MTVIEGLFLQTASVHDRLDSDPETATLTLDRAMESIRIQIEAAKPPLLYLLEGPEPTRATPMQYGGFYLERDRALLETALAKGESWLWVRAGEGAYLDFVSDLPANVFAWDARATGFSLEEMRKLRSGRLCTNEVGSDEDFAELKGWQEGDRVAVQL